MFYSLSKNSELGRLPVYNYLTGVQHVLNSIMTDDELNIVVFWNVLQDDILSLLAFMQNKSTEYKDYPVNFTLIHTHGINTGQDMLDMLLKEEDELLKYEELFLEIDEINYFYMEPFETSLLKNRIGIQQKVFATMGSVIAHIFENNYQKDVETYLLGFCGYFAYQNTLYTEEYEQICP